MPDENAVVVVCESASAAQAAIRGLFRSGLDGQRVSVAAQESVTDVPAVAYYQHGRTTLYCGRLKAFWNTVWEMLPERAVLAGSGGPILVAGPLARWIIAGLDNAAIFEGLGPMAAGLYSIGIPRDKIADYEAALREGRFLVMAHGPAGQVARARAVLAAALGTAPAV